MFRPSSGGYFQTFSNTTIYCIAKCDTGIHTIWIDEVNRLYNVWNTIYWKEEKVMNKLQITVMTQDEYEAAVCERLGGFRDKKWFESLLVSGYYGLEDVLNDGGKNWVMIIERAGWFFEEPEVFAGRI